MTARRIPVFRVGVELACYLMSGTAFWLSRAGLVLPQDRSPQIVAVIAASMLFTLLGAANGTGVAVTLLIVRLLGVLFLATALGPATTILTLSLLPVILESFEIHRWGTGAVVSGIAILATVLALIPHTAWGLRIESPPAREVIFILFYSVLVAGGAAVLKNRRERAAAADDQLRRLEEAVRRLTDTNVDYQSYAAFVREESVEQERKRITREIHDIIGYTMTNLLMIIQAALFSGPNDRDRVRSLLLKAQSHVNESLGEARQALRRLRDEPISRPSGANLFLRLARTFESMTGVHVAIEFANLPRHLPVASEKVIYRLLQESMTNSFRHGRASAIEIQFWYDGSGAIVSVTDNGDGGKEVTAEGIGLAGMRERIESLGGTLSAGPVPGGFAVHATVPFREETEGGEASAATG